MDKYLANDFLPDIVIHNTLSICGTMIGWGIWDPIRVLGFYCLIGFHMVLI